MSAKDKLPKIADPRLAAPATSAREAWRVFGIMSEFVEATERLAGVRPAGVACHIGSQITDLAPMEAAFSKMRGLVQRLKAEGLPVERLDLGGGLGVPYFNQPEPPAPDAYAAMIARATAGLDVQLAFEPGRMIAANACKLPSMGCVAQPGGLSARLHSFLIIKNG